MLAVYRPFLYSASALNWGTADALISDSTNCCRWTFHLSVGIFINLTETIGSIVPHSGCLCIDPGITLDSWNLQAEKYHQHRILLVLTFVSSRRHPVQD